MHFLALNSWPCFLQESLCLLSVKWAAKILFSPHANMPKIFFILVLLEAVFTLLSVFLLSCTTELSCNLHEPSSFLVVWNGMSKAACPSPPSHSIGKSRNSSNLNACSCHVKKATILFTDLLPYDGNLFILHPFLVPAKDKDLKHWNRTVGSCTPLPLWPSLGALYWLKGKILMEKEQTF